MQNLGIFSEVLVLQYSVDILREVVHKTLQVRGSELPQQSRSAHTKRRNDLESSLLEASPLVPVNTPVE